MRVLELDERLRRGEGRAREMSLVATLDTSICLKKEFNEQR
jgi:hypothetical protein